MNKLANVTLQNFIEIISVLRYINVSAYSNIKSKESHLTYRVYTVSLSNTYVHISRVVWHVAGNWEVNRREILRTLRNLVTVMNANESNTWPIRFLIQC